MKKDKMKVVKNIIILILINVFENVVYKIMEKCNIKRKLKKIGIGGVLDGVDFII